MNVPAGVRDGAVAAAGAAVLSGIPSTAHAFATGLPVLDATAAAGSLVLPATAPRGARIVAGGAAHVVISAGWGLVLSYALPRRYEVRAGAMAGVAIAALDLGLVGRRVPDIRRLPLGPQIADHVAFGMVVGWILRRRRARAAAAG